MLSDDEGRANPDVPALELRTEEKKVDDDDDAGGRGASASEEEAETPLEAEEPAKRAAADERAEAMKDSSDGMVEP